MSDSVGCPLLIFFSGLPQFQYLFYPALKTQRKEPRLLYIAKVIFSRGGGCYAILSTITRSLRISLSPV